MFGLFKSVVELASDIVDVAVAPVEIAVDVTKAAVKPVADAAREITEDVKDSLK